MSRVTPSPHRPRPFRQAAFTLIELLTVMVIIILLLSITISVQKGITNKQNNTKAAGEIEAMQSALEQFKAKYGDYPPSTDAAGDTAEDILAKALTGRARYEPGSSGSSGRPGVVTFPGAQSIPMPNGTASSSIAVPYPAFLDLSQFTLGTDSTHPNPVFVDPWGNPYLYRYKTLAQATGTGGVQWYNVGYLIVSRGPDQLPPGNSISQIFPSNMAVTGNIDPNYFTDTPGNADNICSWNLQ
jgi:type II secretory pathway pseudopilin PulG